MPDQRDAAQQTWHRPAAVRPPQPASAPPAPPAKPLPAAGPLLGTDTIMVARDGGAPVAVPLSVLAAYLAGTAAALKQGIRA